MNINDIVNRLRGVPPVRPVVNRPQSVIVPSSSKVLDFGFPYVTESRQDVLRHNAYHNRMKETQLGPLNDPEFYKKMYDFQIGHYGGYLHTLNDREKKMLNWNRPARIGEMGDYLRGKANSQKSNLSMSDTARLNNGIRTMDGIIDKSPPTKQDLILYRGMRSVSGNIDPGTHFYYEPGFMSTSLNPFVASGFGKRTVLRIRVPAGTKMAPVTAHQFKSKGLHRDHPDIAGLEQELTAGRGHTVKIDGTMKGDINRGVQYVDAELMPQGPPGEHHHRPLGTVKQG